MPWHFLCLTKTPQQQITSLQSTIATIANVLYSTESYFHVNIHIDKTENTSISLGNAPNKRLHAANQTGSIQLDIMYQHTQCNFVPMADKESEASAVSKTDRPNIKRFQ